MCAAGGIKKLEAPSAGQMAVNIDRVNTRINARYDRTPILRVRSADLSGPALNKVSFHT